MAPSSRASSSPGEGGTGGVHPYRMHVSQKYLDLTRQKLELTRLPRDPRNASVQSNVGVSKAQLEPLIDHWMEEYDWRAQEGFYNDTLPQFRVPINGTRLHFVHKQSSAASAIPLLFIHGFPESFISVSKIIDPLCNPISTPPRGDENVQAFHVVAPSIPGFGFSDPIPEAGNNMQSTAQVFDLLMKGLGYRQYMIHGSGWGFKIARVLALMHSDSCLAIHTVNPEIPMPRSGFGYTAEDMALLSNMPPDVSMQMPGIASPTGPPLPYTANERSQTLAYALCDSPSGLLAYLLDIIQPPVIRSPSQSPEGLRPPVGGRSPSSPQSYGTPQTGLSPGVAGRTSPQISRSPQPGRSPQHQPSPASTAGSSQAFDLADLTPWSSTALINWTMLYWLPGPEVCLRWLANSSHLLGSLWTGPSTIPLGITQFREPILPGSMAGPGSLGPPQWAEAYHRVAMVRQREGRVRFPAWEAPAELVMDIREFVGLLSMTGIAPPMPMVAMR